MLSKFHVNDRCNWDGNNATIVGMQLDAVRLRLDSGREELVGITEFQRSATPIDSNVCDVHMKDALLTLSTLESVPVAARERAETLREHVCEIINGHPYSDPAITRPEYDPTRTAQAARCELKSAELAHVGIQRSAESLRRDVRAYHLNGLLGLVDKRSLRKRQPWDERLIAIGVKLLDQDRESSQVPTTVLIARMREAYLRQYPGQGVPSERTFRRILQALGPGFHRGQSAKTRMTMGNSPRRTYRSASATRPGERVEIDTTPIDIRVLDDEGNATQAHLTVMLDVATMSVLAGLIRPGSAKSFDHALLLAMALFPAQFRPKREHLNEYLAAQGIDVKGFQFQEMPYIVPESITRDNGKDYRAATTEAALQRYGISVHNAAPHTPTDKARIERNFRSINDLFCAFVDGHKGSNVIMRGKAPDAEALPLPVVATMFDIWVRDVWQHREHDALRDPAAPGRRLSPNQRYASLVPIAPEIPMPISEDEYLELLPVTLRKLSRDGVRLYNRTYRSDDFTFLANEPGAGSRRWPISYHPYDPTHVWLKTDDGWLTAFAANLGAALEPFSGDSWAIARTLELGSISGTEARDRTLMLANAAKRAEGRERRNRQALSQDQQLKGYRSAPAVSSDIYPDELTDDATDVTPYGSVEDGTGW